MNRKSRLLAASLVLAVMVPPSARDLASQDRPAAPGPQIAPSERVSDLWRGEPEGRPSTAPSTAGSLLRLAGWTTAAAACGLLILITIRRFTPAGRLPNAGGAVRVVGRTALSPRHAIYLVRVGSQRLLAVGVSGDRMVTLSEISDPAGILACDREFQAALDRCSDPWAPAESGGAAGGARGAVGEAGKQALWCRSAADLRPYQREIRRLRDLIGGWKALLGHRAASGPEVSPENPGGSH